MLADAADVDADGGVEFEGAAAGGGFRVAEHHADFLADLVGEDADGAGLGDERGELPHGGRHEAGLGADGGVANLAVEFLLGDQGGDGVEDDDVEGVGADEGLADAEGLLAGGRLGDEEVVGIDPEALGVLRVEGVLDVDEGRQAAALLRLGDDGQGEGGFAGGFRAEDLDDAAAGKPPTPSARSMSRLPVGITSTSTRWLSPMRRIEPSPYSFLISLMALSRFLRRSCWKRWSSLSAVAVSSFSLAMVVVGVCAVGRRGLSFTRGRAVLQAFI